MDEHTAATAVWRMLTPDKIFTVKSLWEEAVENQECSCYLPKKARKNVIHFENLLRKYPLFFYVENGQVVEYDPELLTTRDGAIDYFEDILNDYNERPHYRNFRGHIGQANEDIQCFINDFYPGDSFKDFLQSCPEVFVVFDDDTINLIENECLNYFINILDSGEEHYMNFRGHIGQAPNHVIEHINYEYPGEIFLEFLQKYDHIFIVDMEGYVFLVSESDS